MRGAEARIAGDPGGPGRLLGRLPRGQTLTQELWSARHRGILVLLWLHAGALPLVGLAYGESPWHACGHAVPLAACALAATHLGGRLLRAVLASFGLLTASALLVHVTGGLTEAHFHFFVMISVVTLYEDWRTFLLAFAYVVAHHGLVGTLMPAAVFDHGDATVAPWAWAAVHGAFVLAAGVANVVAWRANETATESRTRTERDRADDAQLRLAALVEATDDAVFGMTPDGAVTSWNAGAERLLGHAARDMLGTSILELVPPERRGEERAMMGRVLAGGRLDHFETRRLHARGHEVDVSLTLSLVPGPAGGDGLVGIARDITGLKRRERERRLEAARLRTLVHADHLTGLGNRRQFEDVLDSRMTPAAGRPAGPFSVVLFDLDGFKHVNDTLGHAEGDRVLRLFADRLRAAARTTDSVCRLGGDEFALVLPETGRTAALGVADRVRGALRAERGDVDVSFGAAVWPQDAAERDALLLRADEELYAAKARRPGRPRTAAHRPAEHAGIG